MKPTFLVSLKVAFSLYWRLFFFMALSVAFVVPALYFCYGVLIVLFSDTLRVVLNSNALIFFVPFVTILILFVQVFKFTLNSLPSVSFRGFKVKLMKNADSVDDFDYVDAIWMALAFYWRIFIFIGPFYLLHHRFGGSVLSMIAGISDWVALLISTWWLLALKKTGRWIRLEKTKVDKKGS